MLILLFLQKFWKPIALGIAFIVLCGSFYIKGRIDSSRNWERKIAKEIIKREEAFRKETERLEGIIARINQSRKDRPIDDRRDGCILSSDPYSKDCLQK